MKHKRQHYIPSSYLRAWSDPNCPPGQTPYVWIFSKSGDRVRKKSPKKVFRENDLYTISTEDGGRDLKLETSLSRLESKFSQLRRETLKKRLPLSPEELLYVCMFVAAMYGRTKAYGEHWGGQWRRVLELGEKVEKAHREASDEQRKRMSAALSSPTPADRGKISMEEVRRLAERPIPESLTGVVTSVGPMLFEIPWMVLEAQVDPGFITSDAPCVWFDPADFQTPRPFAAGGLASPTIEVTLPLSPRQMIMFTNRLKVSGSYLPVADEWAIDQLNRRTRAAAHKDFVASTGEARAGWF